MHITMVTFYTHWKELENHLKWLDSWEKEVTDNVNKVLLERKAHLEMEKTVQDNQTKMMYNRVLKKLKKQVQQDKDAIKNI